MATEFHFLSPAWLLALLPLAALLVLISRRDAGTVAWRRVIDPRLLAVLSVGARAGSRLPLVLLGVGGLIAIIALANPTFERQPTPAFRADAARVIVLDLSRSMLADDLTPSRLLRARYKVADTLARSADGQAALIAFAGAPFAVAPLSDDTETIAALLDALTPEIMPVQGSRVDLAIAQAGALLQQAGARAGEVVLLTDDAGDERALAAARNLVADGHRLVVIGVGTEAGAAVPGVRNSSGAIIAKLDTPALRRLARAGGGSYSPLTPDGGDLDQVLRPPGAIGAVLDAEDPRLAEAWHALGPWITLLLLPLGALAFRRGWLTLLLLGAPLWLADPAPALAFGWDDLWQRRDQQAAEALTSGDPARALDLADAPARRGTASYRLGDFTAAADAFAAGSAGTDHYNRGNALALGGQLEQALTAYDQALEGVGDDTALGDDITHNRAQVEALLKQQQPQDGQSQGESGQDPSDESDGQGDEQGSEQGPQGQDQQGQGDQQPSSGQGGQDQQGEPSEAEGSTDGGQSDPQADGGSNDEPEAGEQSSAQDGGDEPPDPQPGQSPSPSSADETGARADAQQGSGQGAERNDGRRGQDRSADDSGDEDTDQPQAPDEQQVERAAEDYRNAAAAAAESEQAEQGGDPASAAGAPAAFSPEEREAQQAAEQWLRRIPDDPAGLLRRKFLYQYRQRASEEAGVDAGNPW